MERMPHQQRRHEEKEQLQRQQQRQQQQQERCLPISVDSLTRVESPPFSRELRRRSREGIHIRISSSSSSSTPWSSSSTDIYSTQKERITSLAATESGLQCVDGRESWMTFSTAATEAGSLSRGRIGFQSPSPMSPSAMSPSAWDTEQSPPDDWRFSTHYPTPPPVPPTTPIVVGCPDLGARLGNNCHAEQQVLRRDREEQENCDEQRELEEPSGEPRMLQLINFRNVAARQIEDIRSLHEYLLHIWSQRSQAVAAFSASASEPPANK